MFNLGIYFETKILGVSQFQISKINLVTIKNTKKSVAYPKNFSVE